MKLFILELIIWPMHPAHQTRIVKFDPSKVSVVTGWSATGKTSIISIIDYVLGAGSCSVPIGAIRDAASWYGLRIETDIGPMRLAREKPEGRQVSDRFWIQQGNDCEAPLPASPVANARTDRIKQLFDDLSRLSNLSIDPEGRGYSNRASFRDMAAFNFLPQHIVANPYTMFFKADTSDHREKLRSIMPLSLGIVTNDDLVRIHSLRLFREELRKLEADLKLQRNSLDRWRANATGAFYRAQELGLLPSGDLPRSLERIIETLRLLVKAGGAVVGSTGRISIAVERLENLRSEERDLDRAITDNKRRLRRIKSLRGSVSDYRAVLEDQRSRVQGVGWFSEAILRDECILCGSNSHSAQRALHELAKPIAELEELSAGTSSSKPVLDKEIVSIEEDLIGNERRLLELRRLRLAAEDAVDSEQGRTHNLESVYRFIGSTEQALQMVGEVEGEDGLQARVNHLRSRIADLEGTLDASLRAEREREIAGLIGQYVKKFIEFLGVEGAEGQPVLDFRELNIKFQREGESKPDFLWEIGSGENWMAYHLATFFALHGLFFRRRANNPVPSFLVIDQPSQVYFPSDTYDTLVGDGPGRLRRSGSDLDDLNRTRQIFRTIARAHRGFLGNLQIIVLDHADETAWGDNSNVVGVENWRGQNDWLIPRSWLS